MNWNPTPRGYRCGFYEIVRNSRNGYAVYIDDTGGWRMLNLECDSLSAAKAFAKHHAEITAT